MTLSRLEASGLLVLFLAQLGFVSTTVRYGFAFAYLLFFLLLIVKEPSNRQGLLHAIRHTFMKPGGTHQRVEGGSD
jgi:hypothetical protein